MLAGDVGMEPHCPPEAVVFQSEDLVPLLRKMQATHDEAPFPEKRSTTLVVQGVHVAVGIDGPDLDRKRSHSEWSVPLSNDLQVVSL